MTTVRQTEDTGEQDCGRLSALYISYIFARQTLGRPQQPLTSIRGPRMNVICSRVETDSEKELACST